MPHRILCLSYACPVVKPGRLWSSYSAVGCRGARAPAGQGWKMDEHGIDAVEWAGGIWLAGTGRNSGSCPSGRGGRRGLLGRKQQDSATPPDVADSCMLLPTWAWSLPGRKETKGSLWESERQRERWQRKEGQRQGKGQATVMRSCVSEDVSLSSPAVCYFAMCLVLIVLIVASCVTTTRARKERTKATIDAAPADTWLSS